ncbi:MAG TPA: serine/threonine-protein kinase [Polyangia bacterium]|nr:serine/threonine-protein kinase [Polyangia bacterium]
MAGNTGDSLTNDGEPIGTLPPGSRLGKYEIRRLLGAGGMGAVYEAHHTEIGKRVAIKVLAPELAAAPGARTRFLREAQLTSKINHPNIVDVNDMGNEDGRAFIVMEFLDGEDLAQRLDRTGPMQVDQLIDIMLPVCSAVAEAHRVGITHRDLKPQNIFLATGPRGLEPKVLDFGISKGNDTKASALTGTGMIGTPFYFAPEQILDARSAGPASDQYALGVILYECLTGRRPYEAENLFLVFQAIVDANAPPVGQLRPDLAAPLQQIVGRAMHKAPTARFGSASEMARALLPFASSRVRSSWEHSFVETGPSGGTTLSAALSPPIPSPLSPRGSGPTPWPARAVPATTPMPRTPLPPPRTPVSSGTMPLPTSGTGRAARAADSLFDVDLRPRRRVGPLLAIAGAAAAVAVVGAVMMMPGHGRGSPQPATSASRSDTTPLPGSAEVLPPSRPAIEPPPAPPPIVAAPAQPEPGPEPKFEPKLDSRPQAKLPPPRPKKLGAAPRHSEPARPRHGHAPSDDGTPILNPNAAPILD